MGEILLDTGTNELEILTFSVKRDDSNDNPGLSYGINVSKVSEIIKTPKITLAPGSADTVLGVICPRGKEIYTVIDLRKVLFGTPGNTENNTFIIITNFNNLNMGFLVDSVSDIQRLSWAELIKPDATISNSKSGLVTGIFRAQNDLITILDFEKIVSDISPAAGLDTESLNITEEEVEENNGLTVMIAEDSATLNELLYNTLTNAGISVIRCYDGQEALDKLKLLGDKVFDEKVGIDVLVSDVEMPTMDGLHLANVINHDEKLKNLPVVIFSSLVNDALKRKCESIGIPEDRMISKPDIGTLVAKIEAIVKERV